MDSNSIHNPHKTLAMSSKRHRCAACFKQYKKREHLIEHMKISYHSAHQPKCGVCQKHCKSFESLKEHTTGALSKRNCSEVFSERGCDLCMRIFESSVFLIEHEQVCRLRAPTPLQGPSAESQIYDPPLIIENERGSRPEAVAIDCAMAGGGSDGTLDVCVRVCLVNEGEKLIFHAYVLPQIPITNYRYEVTGITEDHLKDAMPLEEVRDKILHILHNGESIGILRLSGGKARVLVGHELERDLYCLSTHYPDHLLRDTAKYPPLMKTNLVSHSLKYLANTYLGYHMQSEMHDPYQNCVSAMRLYTRLRSQKHQTKANELLATCRKLTKGYDSLTYKEIEGMSSNELFDVSKSNYKCWCLD
ncbi:RNA exonuclease 4 isoform X3 [Salvia hispanica]|uniref:RNA exonuclease 4 isoform X3 n=1 Tax=Salvia hispanica TaxID=49212 RepID=UPI00200919A9|nr:RNA exonuclease 4 isoform X3 [Salvia hispanica]